MRKFQKPFLIILIFFIINLNISLYGNNAISYNDFYIYQITSAHHYLDIGENKVTNQNFLFGVNKYPIGVKVNSTIDYITSYGIMFRHWIENYSRICFLTSNWFNVLIFDYSFITLYYTYLMVKDFGNGFWIDLTLYQILLYVDPQFNSYLQNPQSLGGEIENFFYSDYFNYPDINWKYSYSVDQKLLYFESWFGGKVNDFFGKIITNDVDYPTDISFGNSLHFAIHQESGNVYGFGRRGWVEGTINNTNVKVCMSCEYEIEGYDLTDYAIGSYHNYFKNNKSMIILSTVLPGSVILIVGTILLITFKRKKALPKNHT
ncbi:MAG: hypothetical protein JXA54_01460 [Candidatus Heimdallarchaeota archaeon]|nr:hypothetical protein [Candidatus Heimdallarchaeota archaeon]